MSGSRDSYQVRDASTRVTRIRYRAKLSCETYVFFFIFFLYKVSAARLFSGSYSWRMRLKACARQGVCCRQHEGVAAVFCIRIIDERCVTGLHLRALQHLRDIAGIHRRREYRRPELVDSRLKLYSCMEYIANISAVHQQCPRCPLKTRHLTLKPPREDIFILYNS